MLTPEYHQQKGVYVCVCVRGGGLICRCDRVFKSKPPLIGNEEKCEVNRFVCIRRSFDVLKRGHAL